MGEGEGDWKDIVGGMEGLEAERMGEEGTPEARWVEELCGMLTGTGCMGLAESMFDDEQRKSDDGEGCLSDERKSDGKKGKEERAGQVRAM
jgi:hypothetical protein